MKKIILTVLAWIFILNTTVSAASFKKYAGEFAYLGAGPRGNAMGGAFTAVSNDVTSIYWNPAGLMEANGFQAHFMHSKQFISTIQNNFIAFSLPYSQNSAAGLSLYYLTVNDIKDSRNAYNIIEDKVDPSKVTLFNTGDYILTASYAQKFNEQLNWGVNLKLIYRDFEIESASGIGFDAALKYSYGDLKLGAVIRDATGTLMTWTTNTTQFITPSLRLGAAYWFEFDDYNLEIIPAVDLNILGENREYASQINAGPYSADFLTGMEINYDAIISLRFGIDDLQRFNSGAGIQLPHVNVDYAFTAYANELGDIHRISLHINFGDLIKITD
jgi:hypothetical protein